MYVHQEQDDVGFVGCEGHLLANLLLKDIVTAHDPSAGVDNGELALSPLAFAVLTVASSAGLLAHDGVSGLSQAVEKGALAYIRATHYGYNV